MRDEFPTERTRRSLLRVGAGVLGLGAVGSVSAHPGADKGRSSAPSDGTEWAAVAGTTDTNGNVGLGGL